MTTFKVGDRIRMLPAANDVYWHTQSGATGVVLDMDWRFIKVDFDYTTLNDNNAFSENQTFWVDCNYAELITEDKTMATFNPGDKVMTKGTSCYSGNVGYVINGPDSDGYCEVTYPTEDDIYYIPTVDLELVTDTQTVVSSDIVSLVSDLSELVAKYGEYNVTKALDFIKSVQK